jgi:FlaA1/EpsC-like NDP-sugar epimerase
MEDGLIIDIGKLLCREVETIPNDSLKYLKNKRVLVTGAGGSIGSELCRQMLFAGAKRLFLFGHGEDSIYKIQSELEIMQRSGTGEKTAIVPVIGELQDSTYVKFIIDRLKADVVFHTAAHKHVPMMECNPVEAIKNNVFGTLSLVEAVKNSSVNKLIFISTDKAVEPTCVYGASKALSEQIILSAEEGSHRFLVVRFGNVFGTQGSVIPLWIKQLECGGPVTLTSPLARRFFMTIQEASSLIIKIVGNGLGGQLYILDMGEPMLMKDVLERLMIQLLPKGYKNIEIEYIGLRPGEKLEEKLWSGEEEVTQSDMPGILSITKNKNLENLGEILSYLKPICFYNEEFSDMFRDKAILRKYLKKLFPNLEMGKNAYNKY